MKQELLGICDESMCRGCKQNATKYLAQTCTVYPASAIKARVKYWDRTCPMFKKNENSGFNAADDTGDFEIREHIGQSKGGGKPSQTSGSIKSPCCKADWFKKFFARRERAFKHVDYHRYTERMELQNKHCGG